MMKNLLLALTTLFFTTTVHAGGLQNSDFATPAQITGAGGSLNQLLHDVNIWSTVLSEQLSTALSNGDIANALVPFNMEQQSTPSNPASGFDKCYVKSDNKFYCLSSAGTESLIGPGAGTGTVTSVALTTPSYFTVSGSPITSSGTLAITGTSESANQVLATPNGSSGALAVRALVGADLPYPSASTLGGIESYAAVASQWINAISTSGVPSSTQPSYADLSGSLPLSVSAPITSTGGATPTIGITQSSATTNGYLSSVDWNTFNNKLSVVPIANTVFVNSAGNDTTCALNRIDLPCMTIAKAMSLFTVTTAYNNIIIQGPGTYSVDGLDFLQNVTIQCTTQGDTFLDFGNAGVTMDSSWNNAGNNIGGISNCSLLSSGTSNVVFDFSAFTSSNTFNLLNDYLPGNQDLDLTDNPLGPSATFIIQTMIQNKGNLNIQDTSALISGYFNQNSGMNITATSSGGANVYATTSSFLGNVTSTANGSGRALFLMLSGSIFGSVTLNGANSLTEAQMGTFPALPGISLVSGATLFFAGDAYQVAYNATTPANWPGGVSPANVSVALDDLASSSTFINTLPTNEIFVGSAGGTPAPVAMSGDVSIVASGATTVNTVGGASATNIASTVTAVAAATSTPTANTIAEWDASANMSANAFNAATFVDFAEIATPADPATAHLRLYAKSSPSEGLYYLNSAGTEIRLGTGSGSVTSVNVVSANGFAGTVATPTTTAAITLSTTITGLLKGNGTAISAAVSGTDYQAPISTFAAPSNQFLTGFTAPNTFTAAQPSFANISGSIAASQLPALPTGDLYIGNGANQPAAVAMSGDATIASTGILTLGSVNSNVGSFTNANITVNAKGQITAAANGTGGGVTSVTGSGNIASSGGTTPNITFTGVLPIANGGTNSGTALNSNRVIESLSGAIVEAAAITANRALVSDSNGLPVASSTTATELGYVSGVTSAIQTQLNGKASTTPGLLTIGASNIDWSLATPTAYSVYVQTLSANTTFTFSGAVAGQTIVVRLTNTASNYTVTWPTVAWAGGTAPTMSTGAVSDVYTFVYDGTTYFGSYVQDMF